MSTLKEIDELIAGGADPASAIAAISAARWSQKLLTDGASALKANGATEDQVESWIEAKRREIDEWLADNLGTVTLAVSQALDYTEVRVAEMSARLDAVERELTARSAP